MNYIKSIQPKKSINLLESNIYSANSEGQARPSIREDRQGEDDDDDDDHGIAKKKENWEIIKFQFDRQIERELGSDLDLVSCKSSGAVCSINSELHDDEKNVAHSKKASAIHVHHYVNFEREKLRKLKTRQNDNHLYS